MLHFLYFTVLRNAGFSGSIFHILMKHRIFWFYFFYFNETQCFFVLFFLFSIFYFDESRFFYFPLFHFLFFYCIFCFQTFDRDLNIDVVYK